MKMYEKPATQALDEFSEGVYLASGDNAGKGDDGEPKRCKFGQTEANPGRDKCQFCSASQGAFSTSEEFEEANGQGQAYRKQYVGCPEGMPEKK